MSRHLFLLLSLTALTAGCHKDAGINAIITDIPELINIRVETFKKEPFLCSDASIKEFSFQNARVFGFSGGTCTSEPGAGIYDVSGNNICTLGGLAGSTICNGDPFAKAVLVRTIWQNK